MPDTSSDSADVRPAEGELLAQARRVRVQARVVRSRSAAVKGRIRRRQPLPRLSPRELDVLALLSGGLTTKDLALQLGISINTASYHLANIYRKLGTHSRVEAANAYFMRRRPD